MFTSLIYKARPRNCLSAVNSTGKSNLPPEFLANKAIAQRELLRRFYLATTAAEQLQVVQSAFDALDDLGTALHLLSHTADLALKNQLHGTNEERKSLLLAIYSSLDQQLTAGLLEPVHLANVLWAFACTNACSTLKDDLLENVAFRELALDRIASYNTRDIASMVFAYGTLLRRPMSHPVLCFITSLLKELSIRLDGHPYIKGSFAATDFADLSSTIGLLFIQCPRIDSRLELVNISKVLMDQIAHEMKRQLSNRSMRSPFIPKDLIRFLGGYCAVGSNSDEVRALLDASAAFIVRHISDDHINAVKSPDELARLLRVYVELRHNSVTVPELLRAVGLQLCRLSAVKTALAHTPPQTISAGMPSSDMPLAALASILRSHLELGFSPNDLTLQSLQPVILIELPSALPVDVLNLLGAIAGLGHQSIKRTFGPIVVDLMLRSIADSNDMEMLKDAKQHVQALGFNDVF